MRIAMSITGVTLVLAGGAAFFWNETRTPEAALVRAITPEQESIALPQAPFRLHEPVDEFLERITQKPFGVFITPETSPVQNDRFTGWHTGVDVEYEDTAGDIGVRAIADGIVIESTFAKGYGGVVVIRHIIDGKTLLALYGHLDPASILPKNTNVRQGQTIGVLGEGGTHETDDVRKHLHFSILKKDEIDLRGYVQDEKELEAWYDPQTFYAR